MKTKELYSAIIDIQKKTGQGLSGVVTINQPSIRISINNLIERGLIIKESSGYSSIGHPASNDWYMPSTGYNVWKEIREYGNLMPLFFIREKDLLEKICNFLCTQPGDSIMKELDWKI